MASSYLLAAVALYKAPHFTAFDPNNVISINVDRIMAFTPRPVWIKRYLVPGQNQVQYLITFEPSSADLLDVNILQGVYIEQDGQGVVVDCISVSNFITAADNSGTLTQRYPAGVTAFVSPTANVFCVVRADDGSAGAAGLMSTDYVGQMVGNVQLRSNTSGISHYIINSFTTPFPIGSDSISAGACSS